jgi:hypothetical protein
LLNEAASGFNIGRLETILADGISSRDIELLARLAKNKNMPCDDLARLYDFCKPSIGKIGRSESEILHELAKNPQTPPNILGLLADSEHSWMRSSVAANPNTSISTLRLLSEDKESFVRNYAKGRLRSREQEEKQGRN